MIKNLAAAQRKCLILIIFNETCKSFDLFLWIKICILGKIQNGFISILGIDC